jgi:hypothetical protein
MSKELVDQNGTQTQSETIVINTVMARADFSRLRAYYMYRLHPGRIRNMVICLIISALIIVGWRLNFVPEILYHLSLIVLFGLTAAFIWIDSRARKLEKPGKSIGNRPQKLVLQSDGFTVEWLNYNVPLFFEWNKVQLMAETEHYYFLFVDKLAAVVLPKRGMKPEKNSAVRSYLIEHIPADQQDLGDEKNETESQKP